MLVDNFLDNLGLCKGRNIAQVLKLESKCSNTATQNLRCRDFSQYASHDLAGACLWQAFRDLTRQITLVARGRAPEYDRARRRRPAWSEQLA